MWDLPRPGLELVSPTLAGRFSITAPPGKPLKAFKCGNDLPFWRDPGTVWWTVYSLAIREADRSVIGQFQLYNHLFRNFQWDFAGGAVVRNPPASAGDTGSSPGPGGSHMPWNN